MPGVRLGKDMMNELQTHTHSFVYSFSHRSVGALASRDARTAGWHRNVMETKRATSSRPPLPSSATSVLCLLSLSVPEPYAPQGDYITINYNTTRPLKTLAVSQRPTLAARGEVITMTASSQDSTPSSMAGLFLLLLLLPAVFTQSSAVPATPTPSSFDPLTQPECAKKEHPKVSIQALSPWISTFFQPGVRDYSQLTLDLTRNELIVGARNYLFRLDLSNMSLIQATEWAPDEETRRSCQSKGKTEIECQNYIRVLLVNKTEVMTCGTNAFQPLCITREVGNMSSVLERVNGVARCPYDPRHNSTAVVN
ncbi:hypothetical protein L3Q82_004309 [Scortum barcoo]|uniref:Uncharacterized protein n=1 Tax=Scortum barcoo TaxID=214431 RepID=A0ACB8VJD2_9TELE|nr:hypothetical protein L3Q82_004309 [Scortum barcoo]